MTSHRILLFVTFCLAVFQFSAVGVCQSGNVWGTTPVFDGGRVMPLTSYAKRIVTEICGDSRPFIVRDDSILAELNRVIDAKIGGLEEPLDQTKDLGKKPKADNNQEYRFLIRGSDLLGNFDTGVSGSTAIVPEQTAATILVIRNMTSSQAEMIYRRIRSLIPAEGRYFNSDELLLSWIVEPEIWDYIPIFAAAESDYRNDVLDALPQNDARAALRRVAVFQLKQSSRFQQRLVEIERKRMQRQFAEVPIRYDQITERIAAAMTTFQELTFHPRKVRPTRMIGLLQQTINFSAGQTSSYASAFESWGHLLELGEIPARQSLEASTPGLRDEEENETKSPLHPVTQRWHDIAKKIQLLAGAFDRLDKYGEISPPNLTAVEKQFEILLRMIDVNFEESEALMEYVYPSVVFRKNVEGGTDMMKLLPLLSSKENREKNKEIVVRIVLNYHYSIKALRTEIEAAYLALYDNGHSMRVLPIAASSAVGDTGTSPLGVQPWGTIQMVLYGGDFFIQRFFDANYHLNAAGAVAAAMGPAELLEEIRKLRDQTKQSVVAADKVAEVMGKQDADKPEETLDEKVKPAETTLNGKKESSETVSKVNSKDTQSDQAAPEPVEMSDDQILEKELFPVNEPYVYLSQSRSSAAQPPIGDRIGRIRSDFISLTAAYTTGVRNINEMARAFQESLRNAATASESLREQFINENNLEYAAKTLYPQRGDLTTEFRYHRLAPFFWMWIFAAGAIVFAGFSLLLGSVRWDVIGEVFTQQGALKKALQASKQSQMPQQETKLPELDSTNTAEEFLLWTGVAFLALSIFVTFIGGVMRAWITGWAPVTNMYETVVLMAFSASLFGLWYALYPLIHPVIQLAWRYSSFPAIAQMTKVFERQKPKPTVTENPEDRDTAARQAADFGLSGGMPIGMAQQMQPEDSEESRQNRLAKTTLFWQSLLFIPRLVLMFLTFLLVVNLSYGEYAHEHGVFAAAVEMLKMSDFIDWLVVVACIGIIVWFVPQLILTALLIPILLCRPSLVAADIGIVSQVETAPAQPQQAAGRSEMSSVFHGETAAMGGTAVVDNSGSVWLSMARHQILNRGLFVIVAASVALLAGLASYFNTSEFNPDIKPIVAVLRSNFWLTVHVIAIVVSYAAAMVAWGMAVVGLGDAIFGHYRYTEVSPETPAKRPHVRVPVICEMFAPIIQRLLQSALVLLVIGTVLGARWADYSWGRFWSWDPKEVWALITILFYVIVLHGRIARFYNRIGIMIGALFASIAVIMTWYGINFVFKGSMHSYGGGTASMATFFLGIFIIANILWGFLAIFRYSAEMYGREAE